MESNNLSSLRSSVIAIAREAGVILLSYYGKQKVDTEMKANGSPVTEADISSSRYIIQALRDIAPEIPCLCEEEDIPDYQVRMSWRRFWLVDPLDGTKEFLARNGEFTVNIGLIEDGKPVLGVVYAPALSLLYYGSANEGSWKQQGITQPMRIYSNPWRFGNSLIVAESRSHSTPALEKFLSSLNVKERIKMGSSLKFCLVAEGSADIYPRLGPTMEWDTAAGDAVYRYSGQGDELETGLAYNTPTLQHAQFVIGDRRSSQTI